MSTSDLIQPRHLSRRAVIYVRQSSPHQVLTNTESQRLQYAMTRRATELGWHEKDVLIVDDDTGRTATGSGEGNKNTVDGITGGVLDDHR